jgi:hypothetical protein
LDTGTIYFNTSESFVQVEGCVNFTNVKIVINGTNAPIGKTVLLNATKLCDGSGIPAESDISFSEIDEDPCFDYKKLMYEIF